ncbi:cytochrome c oxidase subunit II [Thermohalobaculum sediminis]|uniref:cytochrome c oxidase subunit II n=1 Tax=Thermohalobaculum sediminis TaxID=2939436 RepID=UPI0029E7FA19|nr:cytochrome c oxidase subunit II [Limibaculum sediminis]
MARISTFAMSALIAATAGLAQAQDVLTGKPHPNGIALQAPVTPVAHDLVWLDNMLLVIITLISIFVLALLVIVVMKYNAKANPTPARFTHNAVLEVFWTAIPVIILFVIAVPSLKLLFKQLDVPEADLTIKATGNQWFWSYEYPDQGISLDAFMIGGGSANLTDEIRGELADAGYSEDEFLLATDTRVVVPVNANVHVLVTGSDVIHAWAVPSFGVKIDAIPGRTNETWFRAEQVGTYFGQCSELCGKDHSYMPIVVEVVSQEDYDAWVAEQTASRAGATKVALNAAD